MQVHKFLSFTENFKRNGGQFQFDRNKGFHSIEVPGLALMLDQKNSKCVSSISHVHFLVVLMPSDSERLIQ